MPELVITLLSDNDLNVKRLVVTEGSYSATYNLHTLSPHAARLVAEAIAASIIHLNAAAWNIHAHWRHTQHVLAALSSCNKNEALVPAFTEALGFVKGAAMQTKPGK